MPVTEIAVQALDTELERIASKAIGVRALALDDLIGTFGNDAVARERIDEKLLPSLQAEILAEWGDRASALAQLASPEAIAQSLAALGRDARNSARSVISDDVDDGYAEAIMAATIRGLALQIHNRKDWEEILDQPVGNHTLRDYLVAAVGAQVQEIEDDGTRPPDAWADVGLEPFEGDELLRSLPDDLLSEITAESLLSARLTMSATRVAAGLPAEPQGDADDA